MHPAFFIVFYVGLLVAAVALCVAAARGDRAAEVVLDERQAWENTRPLSSALSREHREIVRRMHAGDESPVAAAEAAQRTAQHFARRP